MPNSTSDGSNRDETSADPSSAVEPDDASGPPSQLQVGGGRPLRLTLAAIGVLAAVGVAGVGGFVLAQGGDRDGGAGTGESGSTPTGSTDQSSDGSTGPDGSPTGPPTEVPSDLPTIPSDLSTGTVATGPPSGFTNLPPEFTAPPTRIGPSTEPSDIDSLFPR